MGNLVKETFFNGHSDDFRYNSLNQLVTYKTTTNDTYNYEYDKRGNRLGDIGKKENKKYTYSLENQLVEGTNWKGDKSAYSYNALGIRVNNKQTTHSGNVYDRDYVIDYTTVYGIAPTVQNYILPGDIDTAADGWDDGSTTGGFDIGKMLAAIGDGFNTLRKNGSYIFVYDYLQNLLAVNGKTGTAQDVEKAADYELIKPCINDFVNHFLGRTVDNSHIIGIGDNNHKLPAYAGAGVTTSDAGFADVSVASFENSDIMVISPNYFDQKHIYTDRGQRMEQKTDTAPNQSGNGGNIKLLYVHEDIMGNTRYHTKDNGQSYAELEYDVWGNPTSPGMLLNNDNGVFIFAQFTGHIYDTVLDIYFAEARFYDAKNRQWLSSDPMKDGLNWYQYVRSNPATWVDPSGLYYIIYDYDPNTRRTYVDARQAELSEIALSSAGIVVFPYFSSAIVQTGQYAGWNVVGGPSMVRATVDEEVKGIVVGKTIDFLDGLVEAARGMGAIGKKALKSVLKIASLADGAIDYIKNLQYYDMYGNAFKFARAANVSFKVYDVTNTNLVEAMEFVEIKVLTLTIYANIFAAEFKEKNDFEYFFSINQQPNFITTPQFPAELLPISEMDGLLKSAAGHTQRQELIDWYIGRLSCNLDRAQEQGAILEAGKNWADYKKEKIATMRDVLLDWRERQAIIDKYVMEAAELAYIEMYPIVTIGPVKEPEVTIGPAK